MRGKVSKTGVFVANNFRDNLIIDRFDPIFETMRRAKVEHLRSENSEDAITWNVFRTLRQIEPTLWFLPLFTQAFGSETEFPVFAKKLVVTLWPPVSSTLPKEIEGPSEIDVSIEGNSFVWFIECKYKSDVNDQTTHNETRDQVLRNLDVGSKYAGARDFYFALLILDKDRSPLGSSLIEKYKTDKDEITKRVPHRPEGLSNLKGLGLLTWHDLASILGYCSRSASREEDRVFAQSALNWLIAKGISPKDSNSWRATNRNRDPLGN